MNSSIKFPAVYFVRRLAEFILPLIFLVGIFLNLQVLWIIPGIFMLLEDIMSMLTGELNPTFPIIAAIIAVFLIKPWFLGVFWSIEVFAILNVPTSFIFLVSKKARTADREKYFQENPL